MDPDSIAEGTAAILAIMSQDFMQPDIVLDSWVCFESLSEGTSWIPEDFAEEYETDPSYKETERCVGYGARLSAPGYLDRTDWTVFDTVQEAAQDLIDTYYE